MTQPCLAFGAAAEAYMLRVPSPTAPLLVFDANGASQAQRAAVDLKRRYGTFDLLAIYDEPRWTVGAFMAQHVASSYQTYDERRLALDTLARNELIANGQPQHSYADVDGAILSTMRDVAALAGRWIVRSWTEYYRLAVRFEHEPAAVERWLLAEPLPHFERDVPGDAIVVWAPELDAYKLIIIAMALEETRRPVWIVCKGNLPAGLRAQCIAPAQSGPILAAAALVVAASPNDPGAAYAFLERSIPVVAATSSGIGEYAPEIHVFEPWNRRSILDAALRGLALTSPKLQHTPCYTPPPVVPAAVQSVAPAPLVSIVVRTCDRERLLHRALRSIAGQGYANVEALVVNNGGRDVSPIVGAYPFATSITIPAAPIWQAANAALAAARGKYVCLLDDDDALFPEHLNALVAALERSGGEAAYADAINAYVVGGTSRPAVRGYAAVLVPAVVPSVMLSRCQIVGSSRVVFRREFITRSGSFVEDLPVAGDYELWLRISQASDFVRVNAITSVYTQFEDGSNVSLKRGSRYLDAHRIIYALHPAGARPGVRTEREQVLQFLGAAGGLGMTPPAIPFNEPFPLD
ncbi:MAG: glycosyltransferase family 2 protein [Candidatus Eremiobacteraeota bacterium]|nr:glycosyltransferase family 2 protein [Candidatus Eremiobacteraeota bacterium]